MTIRFECGQCGSILKIKEELAGKPGKCPKCRTKFTVPNPIDDSGEVSLSDEESSATARDDAPSEKSARSASASDDEFDPAAFLMQDDSPPPKKRSSSTKSATPKRDAEDDDDASEDEVFQIRRNESSGAKSKRASLPLDDDDDEDESDKRKVARAKPAAVMAVAASNAAGDLLSQSAKKGRKTSWNEVDPNAKEESRFDWQGLWQAAGKQIILPVAGGIVGVIILYLGANWLLGGRSDLPDLGQVTGKVTFAGQPIVQTMVFFHPIRPETDKNDKKKWVSSASAMTNDQGMYELTYVADAKGAPLGKCRVEVQPPGSVNATKNWVGPTSTEIREVKSGRQVFDLELSQ